MIFWTMYYPFSTCILRGRCGYSLQNLFLQVTWECENPLVCLPGQSTCTAHVSCLVVLLSHRCYCDIDVLLSLPKYYVERPITTYTCTNYRPVFALSDIQSSDTSTCLYIYIYIYIYILLIVYFWCWSLNAGRSIFLI